MFRFEKNCYEAMEKDFSWLALHSGYKIKSQPHFKVPTAAQQKVQYAKTKGEGLVYFYHVNDTNVYLGRQREGFPIKRMHFMYASFILTKEWLVSRFASIQTPALGRKLQEHEGLKLILSVSDPFPPLST